MEIPALRIRQAGHVSLRNGPLHPGDEIALLRIGLGPVSPHRKRLQPDDGLTQDRLQPRISNAQETPPGSRITLSSLGMEPLVHLFQTDDCEVEEALRDEELEVRQGPIGRAQQRRHLP